MRTITSALFGLLAWAIAPIPSAYANLITATYTGTVDAGGYDYVGRFGQANTGLAGQLVTIVFQLDTSIGDYALIANGTDTTEYRLGTTITGVGSTPGPVLSSSITIGGNTVVWVPDYTSRTYAEKLLPDMNFNPDGHSGIGQSSEAHIDDDWTQLYVALAKADMTLPFGIDALGSGFVYPPLGSNGYAAVWHYNDPVVAPFLTGRIYDFEFTFAPETYALTATVLPEPFSLSLFGAGLAGTIAMRRREKQARARSL